MITGTPFNPISPKDRYRTWLDEKVSLVGLLCLLNTYDNVTTRVAIFYRVEFGISGVYIDLMTLIQRLSNFARLYPQTT